MIQKTAAPLSASPAHAPTTIPAILPPESGVLLGFVPFPPVEPDCVASPGRKVAMAGGMNMSVAVAFAAGGSLAFGLLTSSSAVRLMELLEVAIRQCQSTSFAEWWQ